MEIDVKNDGRKLSRAKKRVEKLKAFYVHLVVYVVVNTVITAVKVIRNVNEGEAISDAFWDFETFSVWFFWGIGLAFHAAKVFSYSSFFGKDWEERQIQKYMEKDKRESEKFR